MRVASALLAWWVPLLLVSFRPAPLLGQLPRLFTELDTSVVTVGDRVELIVGVEHDPSATVAWPDSVDLAPFEVLVAEPLALQSEGGRKVTGVRFTLAVFELGDLEIPSFDVRVAAPDGSLTTVSTDPYVVTVQSVGLDEGGDIRAIRGPLGIPLSVIYVLPWLMLLVLLGALGFWLWQRRRPEEPDARRSVVIPGLPHEEAYEALDHLAESGLLERGEIKEYHIIVSEIVRVYIEARFRVYALEMTTSEVTDRLSSTDLPVETVQDFERFGDHCDLVKFAKLSPRPESCREILAAARGFVDKTRPRPADVVAGGLEEESGGGSTPKSGPEDRDESGRSTVLQTAQVEGA
ncbi:MAG: hypothetical protein VYD78_08235 [Gemmatimonadota bacterium]|nr:hypothetical protein [Gemmatimonadota bacterium]